MLFNFSLSLVLFVAFAQAITKYEPTWESIDSRPLPSWYDEAKIGVFMHWGVFSVPSFDSEWFWEYWRSGHKSCVDFMKENYPPGFKYADFAPQFKAELFDPDEWADLLKASGAKYYVLTSKHHEGFTMWPSKVSWNWNAMDVGPHRDLVGDLANSIRKRTDIHFGLYHSLFEWYNPVFGQDRANNYKTQEYVKNKALPELYEIVNTYKPELIWSDGDWMAPPEYWNSTHFLAWLYNESPVKDTIVVNDRWGRGTACKHGGYYNCKDQFNPGVLQKHKWENAMTIDKWSWGYCRNHGVKDFKTIEYIITSLVETVSCGGNFLVNIGPTSAGRIIPFFEEKLRQMGSWLKVNGEAIYASKPWTHQNDTMTKGVWYTSKPQADGSTVVYAIALFWPNGTTLALGAPSPTETTKVTLLGYPNPIKFSKAAKSGMVLNIPVIPFNQMPCDWAWVYKIENLAV